jgi:hypothetical protein
LAQEQRVGVDDPDNLHQVVPNLADQLDVAGDSPSRMKDRRRLLVRGGDRAVSGAASTGIEINAR